VRDANAILSISLINAVPVVYGIIFSFIYKEKHNSLGELFGISFKGHQYSVSQLRMIYLFILSFLTIYLLNRLLDPVPAEGPLRTIFILTIISLASLYNYSLIKISCNSLACIVLHVSLLVLLFLMIFGLGLHKPWSYLMFVSPFYWSAWSWIIPSPAESIAYSGIALLLSGIYMTFSIYFIRK